MICASTVSDPVLQPGRKLPVLLIVPPPHGADPLVIGTGVPGQHRFVGRGGAFDNLPVNRHFFSGLTRRCRPPQLIESNVNRGIHRADAAVLGFEAINVRWRAGASLGARSTAARSKSKSRSPRRIPK